MSRSRKTTLLSRPGRRDRLQKYSRLERAIGIGFGCFLGALAGLMLGVGLACFGLTMWLWLVLPLVGATIGGAIGWNFPFSLATSSSRTDLIEEPAAE
ncbi:MAG: hypothetical protein AAF264_12675 [Pseudomonadota bacterium]